MPGLGFFVLMTFTWPLLGGHLVQVLSGAAKAAGFARRIYSAFLLSGSVGVAFIAQDAEEALGHGARQLIICALAALTALAQVLLEPISRLYLACTSPVPRLYLACISPVSAPQVRAMAERHGNQLNAAQVRGRGRGKGRGSTTATTMTLA